jgi:hypothetical protein
VQLVTMEIVVAMWSVTMDTLPCRFEICCHVGLFPWRLLPCKFEICSHVGCLQGELSPWNLLLREICVFCPMEFDAMEDLL